MNDLSNYRKFEVTAKDNRCTSIHLQRRVRNEQLEPLTREEPNISWQSFTCLHLQPFYPRTDWTSKKSNLLKQAEMMDRSMNAMIWAESDKGPQTSRPWCRLLIYVQKMSVSWLVCADISWTKTIEGKKVWYGRTVHYPTCLLLFYKLSSSIILSHNLQGSSYVRRFLSLIHWHKASRHPSAPRLRDAPNQSLVFPITKSKTQWKSLTLTAPVIPRNNQVLVSFHRTLVCSKGFPNCGSYIVRVTTNFPSEFCWLLIQKLECQHIGILSP